jgi:hypothetical protein
MGLDPLQVLGATVDGKYDLSEFIEQRGSRFVYKATHRFWKEPVTVAFYAHDASSAIDAETARRGYLRSGQQLAQLASRNSAFVQARDCGVLRSQVGELGYIVFEWVEAQTLDQVLANTRSIGSARLGLSAVLDWFFDTIRALSMAHDAGIIHGAIAPSNIFVIGGTFRPTVPLKLRGLTDAAWRSSAAGAPLRPSLDDPRYAAPEVTAKDFDATLLGPWTDVYGLARVFVELLTGAPPRAGSARRATSSYVSRQVQFAMDRALADKPDERFKSLEMFRAALYEGMGARAGRNPRRTMVVADQLVADGSAGVFEIGSDEAPAPLGEARDVDVAQPRVRLAFTQRVDAADAPVAAAPRRTLAVPAGLVDRATPAAPPKVITSPPPSPAPGADYGSGVYDQLTQDRSRTVMVVLAILAVGAMAAYLIVAMGSR